MNKFISGAHLISVQITGNSNYVQLPEIDFLKGKRVKHIDFVKVAKTLDNEDAVTETTGLFITIRETNTQQELIKELTCRALTDYNNRLYINKQIDFPRTYIRIADMTGLVGKYIQLVVWFDYPENRRMIPLLRNRTEINHFELKLTGRKTYFNEKTDLIGKFYQNILLNFPGITPNGNEVFDSEYYVSDKYITLVWRGVEFFKRVPLFLFFQTENDYQLKLQNIRFEMENSFIESALTEPDNLKTVFFNCIIDDNK